MLRPVVRSLQRHLRMPKLAGVMIVYVAVLAVAGLVAWYLVGAVGGTSLEGTSDAPHLLAERIEHLFGPQVHAFGRDGSAEDLSRRTVESVEGTLAKLDVALLAGDAAIGAPAVAVLMLVVPFSFLASGRQLLQGLLHLIPPRDRGHIAHLGARVEPMLRRYARGVIAITISTAAVSELVLGVVFHLPFARLIPAVGPAASIALFAVAAVVGGGGPWTFASVMVLAIPVAAAVKIVLAVWYGEDDGPGGEPARETPSRLDATTTHGPAKIYSVEKAKSRVGSGGLRAVSLWTSLESLHRN